ncbi:MAG: DUF1223 domain-containing protein, partial [Nannocystaceae bacterium]
VAVAASGLAFALAGRSSASSPAPASTPVEAAGPVIVELFSSEGCSSCPPADTMVRELAGRDDVLALEYHVDYWDYIGWADPFADPAYGDRQSIYARALARGSVVTPQVVVGGQAAVGGSRRGATEAAIDRHAAAVTTPVTLRAVEGDLQAGELTLEIRAGAIDRPSEVMLAITESNLRTRVLRGENAGRTLAHAPVVRQLRRVARVDAGDGYQGRARALLDPKWDRAEVDVIVFVQELGQGPIVGAAALARRDRS